MAQQVYGSPLPADASPFTKRRRTGIGGSDAGVILGVSPWGSRLGLWQDKRGLITEDNSSGPTEQMVWGSRLEDAVRKGYAEDTGREVRRVGFRRHPELPFVIGHPDGVCDDRILEVKVSAFGWAGDDLPPQYFAQVQHYLILTGKPLADIAALVGGRELRVTTVEADRAFQDALIEDEAEFWEMVKTGTPPPPDGSEDARKALLRMYPRAVVESIEATPEVEEWADQYMTAKNMLKAAGEVKAEAENRLRQYIGEHDRLIGAAFTATFPNVAGSVSWKKVADGYRRLLEGRGIDTQTLDAIVEVNRGDDSRRFYFSPKEA